VSKALYSLRELVAGMKKASPAARIFALTPKYGRYMIGGTLGAISHIRPLNAFHFYNGSNHERTAIRDLLEERQLIVREQLQEIATCASRNRIGYMRLDLTV
jgi:hypothetical protein